MRKLRAFLVGLECGLKEGRRAYEQQVALEEAISDMEKNGWVVHKHGPSSFFYTKRVHPSEA